jgi:hypothetical protein
VVGRTSGVRSGDQDGDRLSSVRFVLSLAGVRIVARPRVLGVSPGVCGMVVVRGGPRAQMLWYCWAAPARQRLPVRRFWMRSVMHRSRAPCGRRVRPWDRADGSLECALGQRASALDPTPVN